MPERVPLPLSLQGRAFRYRGARDLGVGEGRLRNPELARPFRGVRVPVSTPATSDLDIVVQICRAFQPLLAEGQFFSHLTAAALWNVPLPFAVSLGDPLHVTALRPKIAPRMTGVIGHHVSGGRGQVASRYGFPVSDPTTTWIALAQLLEHGDLVAAADHFILDPARLDPLDLRPYTTMDELAAAAQDFHGRGARSAARAVIDVRQGAESRPETLLRLLLLRAHLPEPALNPDVFDANGTWLGRSDLVWEQWQTIAEYDGDQHRTSTYQYEKDISRIDRFIGAGWHVVRVRKHGLFVDPIDTVSRVVRALRSGGWRPATK